jgi:hypothetical protein
VSQLSPAMQSCLVFAARYAHRRDTGAAFLVVSAIKEQWNNLGAFTKLQIECESNEATKNPNDWANLRIFSAQHPTL